MTREQKNENWRQWKLANPEKSKLIQRNTYQRHRDRILAERKKYYASKTAGKVPKNKKFITHNGETLHKAAWARKLGISPSTFLMRCKKVGNIEQVINQLLTP